MVAEEGHYGRSYWEQATVAALVATAIGPVLTMVLDRTLAPMGFVFALIALAMAGLVLARNRWLVLIVVAVSAVLFVGALRSPVVGYRLAHPAAIGYFVVALLQLVGSAVATAAGLGTFVRGEHDRPA